MLNTKPPQRKPKSMRLTDDQWSEIEKQAAILGTTQSRILQITVALGLTGLAAAVKKVLDEVKR